MSGQDANFVTHDSFGKEPAAGLLTFEVKWKNSGDISCRESNNDRPDEHDVSIFHIDPREERDWNSFRCALLARKGNSIDDRVNYIDSDGDEIPIESQCEFDEALRFATTRSTKKRNVHLIVLRGAKSTNKINEITRKIDLNTDENCETMPPMKLDDAVQETRRISLRAETNCNVKQAERQSDDSPPKWFTSYMQTMKEDIVTEVAQRVTKTMMDALRKKRDSQYDSATSHPQASDSEGLVDSDFEDERTERSSKLPVERIIQKDVTIEKRNSDASSRSEAHRYENNSRRRYRNVEKQRKKQHSKRNVLQPSNNIENQRYCNSPSLNRRQGDKDATKKQQENDDETRPTLAQSSSVNSGQWEEISCPKTTGNSMDQNEELDTPYRRMIASGITQTSFTPIDSTDILEAPILKLRLVNSCNGQTHETKLNDEKVRMGCSVTGNDMIERPNDRVPEYCALSDSDNISIISDVSHNSDLQRINNSFEMILQRSMNFADDENEHFITTEYNENNGEPANEDHDNTRNSSSFELLSEPPSPPLSIHMDEDHFAPVKNDTNNYNMNMNDDTSLDKRGNQNKIEVCPLAIDAQGKIYQRNIIETDEELSDVILEKRTDGAYSFVAETLPGSVRESMIEKGRADLINDDTSIPNDENTNKSDHDKTEIPDEPENPEVSSDVFHESTQSFHSHTASQTNNERNYFPGYPSTSEYPENSTHSHIFVDHNASKGLGDTRQTSPRKQPTSNNSKNHEDFGTERPRTSRKSYHGTSQSSSRRNGNSRQGERGRKFSWSTTQSTRMMDDLVFNAVDPMHILPETLVTGAVHVASSAYTTARRVYDKILTAQTRKPADKSKFGRR